MDKLTAIKIKYQDGTYSDEIPLSALAQHVDWDDNHSIVDIIGDVDFSTDGSIQTQIDNILAQKGVANGIATLNSSGQVPSSQLPSYVDDVLEYASKSAFPSTGESGKIYVDKATNLTYRWSGSAYVEISPSLALGETSSTAYRGDRGKIAYDHSQTTSGNPHNVTKSEVGLGNVGNFKAVSTVASQGLTDTEKSNARTNIGAGTSSFSGSYNDLSNKPTIPTLSDAINSTSSTVAASSKAVKTAYDLAASKTSNTGTVTSVATGIGLTGGTITTSGTLKTKLKSETARTIDALSVDTSTSKLYPVVTDKSGYLAVGVPWTDNDTKNTAGSTDTSSKIFLIGATSQAANPQTYSHDTAYVGTDGQLYSGGNKVLTSHQTIKQDGVSGATANRFGVCSTDAATAAKTVSITSGTFNLESGAQVSVKFSNTNSANNPTLNVNSTGAKNIFVNGSQITTGNEKLLLKGIVSFVYDGTQWHLIGGGAGGAYASEVVYDNTDSGLTATNVQDAVDELSEKKADTYDWYTSNPDLNVGLVTNVRSGDKSQAALQSHDGSNGWRLLMGNAGNINLWKTTDGGANWTFDRDLIVKCTKVFHHDVSISTSSTNVSFSLPSDFHMSLGVILQKSWPTQTWDPSACVSIRQDNTIGDTPTGTVTLSSTSTQTYGIILYLLYI